MPAKKEQVVVSVPRVVKKGPKAVKEVPSRSQFVGAALKRAHKAYAKKIAAQK
jgi:hypothetical protein